MTSINGDNRLDEICRTLEAARRIDTAAPLNPYDTRAQPHAVSNFSRAAYITAVARIKEHILAGDIYQANLTQQFTCPLAPGASPEQLFMRLRREHPAAFAAFIRRRADTVVSISPERFLRVEAARDDDARRAPG